MVDWAKAGANAKKGLGMLALPVVLPAKAAWWMAKGGGRLYGSAFERHPLIVGGTTLTAAGTLLALGMAAKRFRSDDKDLPGEIDEIGQDLRDVGGAQHTLATMQQMQAAQQPALPSMAGQMAVTPDGQVIQMVPVVGPQGEMGYVPMPVASQGYEAAGAYAAGYQPQPYDVGGQPAMQDMAYAQPPMPTAQSHPTTRVGAPYQHQGVALLPQYAQSLGG